MNVYLYLKHFPAHGAPLIGGMARGVHGLASGLASSGATVTILCEGASTSAAQSDRGYSIRCFANRAAGPSFSLSPDLRRYVVHEAKDGVTILNGVFAPSVYSLSRLLSANQLPYVFNPCGVYQPELFRRNRHLKIPYWYLFERPMMRAAAAIQVVDARHVTWLRRRGVGGKAIEVPIGVFPEDARPEDSLDWRPRGAPAFLFFGRADVHIKGLDILVEAFAQIARDIDATLTIQGPGADGQHGLDDLAARLSVSQKVSFLGPDFRTPPAIRMTDYDAFCLTSRCESFGVAGLEAMLAARVLLMTESSGLAPHVEASGCGVVVSPNVESVRAGLTELLNQRSKWKEMGLRGRQYAIDHLAWPRVASTALQHYRQLAA